MLTVKTSVATLSLALFSAGSALAVPGDQTQPYEGNAAHPTENCFWKAVSNDRLWNYVNTDSNSVYQCASYHLPDQARMIVNGEFPRSRYFTFTLYGSVLGNYYIDQDIIADEGSINPFIYGNDRHTENRSYTMYLESGFGPDDPADRPANTLYHGDPSNAFFGNFLCTRIYVSDQGAEPFGGTPLPEVTLEYEDGRQLTGESMCEAVNALSHGFGVPPQAIGFDLDNYLKLREGARYNELYVNNTDPSLPERPYTHPAQNPPEFKAFFNTDYTMCSFFSPGEDCGDPTYNPDGVGLGNPAGRYIESYLDQGFGRVLLLRGKLPRTPQTWEGDQYVPIPKGDDDYYQLRYFSICPQESLATWRVGDCIFDEELAKSVDEEGFYNLVLSRPSWRPTNATPECGYVWASTPPAGDGAGDLNLYNMWIRHALPDPRFDEAAQNIMAPNTEETVMGPYYPRGTYMSLEEFEKRGCAGNLPVPPAAQ